MLNSCSQTIPIFGFISLFRMWFRATIDCHLIPVNVDFALLRLVHNSNDEHRVTLPSLSEDKSSRTPYQSMSYHSSKIRGRQQYACQYITTIFSSQYMQ